MKIIISSVAGIVLCCLCLVSLTWAWFEDGSISGKNSISSATFWAEVSIEKADAAVLAIENNTVQFPMVFSLGESYTLRGLEGGEYKITVSPRGTAREFGGYIAIKAEGTDTLYTEQLKVDEEFVFLLLIDESVGEYELLCTWGSLPPGISENNIIKNMPISISDNEGTSSIENESADLTEENSTDPSSENLTESSTQEGSESVDLTEENSTDSSSENLTESSSQEASESVDSEED